jgi:membrane protease YdiL (CAAX protease family)
LLLILSQFFHGTMFISEEFLFRGYYMEPFFAVGTEGMWGNSIYLILLPIMQKLKCGDQTDP